MSAGDFENRAIATAEFLKQGLGAQLTRNAGTLMRISSDSTTPGSRHWALANAFGNIAERAIWLTYGNWMGYFNPAKAASEAETAFLRKHKEALQDTPLPEHFREICLRLAFEDASDDTFFRRTFSFFPLRRPMIEWFPVFQAALIASEMLNDGPIRSLFLFLQEGNVEWFSEKLLDADAVMNALQDDDYANVFITEAIRPEQIMAGFIRYTEFLSAMDGIFPDVDTQQYGETALYIPPRIVDRDILFPYLTQTRWRFPDTDRAQRAFEAVLTSFSDLVESELDRYPHMGIRWSESDSLLPIMLLTQRFFDSSLEEEEDEEEVQEDPAVASERRRRHTARELRIQELRGDDFRNTLS